MNNQQRQAIFHCYYTLSIRENTSQHCHAKTSWQLSQPVHKQRFVSASRTWRRARLKKMTGPGYNLSLVRRQWRRLELYRMVLPVFMRTHCGRGRFCVCLRASFILMRNVLCAAPSSSCNRNQSSSSIVLLRQFLDARNEAVVCGLAVKALDLSSRDSVVLCFLW